MGSLKRKTHSLRGELRIKMEFEVYDYFYVCDFCLPVCLCTTCMPGVCRGQERVLKHLGLKVQMVVSYHVGAETLTWVL